MAAGVAAVCTAAVASVTAVADAVAAGTRGAVDSHFVFNLVIFGPNIPHPGHSLSMSVAVDLNTSNTLDAWRNLENKCTVVFA